jgi:hypothetical protein
MIDGSMDPEITAVGVQKRAMGMRIQRVKQAMKKR